MAVDSTPMIAITFILFALALAAIVITVAIVLLVKYPRGWIVLAALAVLGLPGLLVGAYFVSWSDTRMQPGPKPDVIVQGEFARTRSGEYPPMRPADSGSTRIPMDQNVTRPASNEEPAEPATGDSESAAAKTDNDATAATEKTDNGATAPGPSPGAASPTPAPFVVDSSQPPPQWVTRPEEDKFEQGKYSRRIKAGPYTTELECEDALASELVQATNEYTDSILGAGAHQKFSVDLEYLKHAAVRDNYVATSIHDIGPSGQRMYTKYWLLVYDDQLKQDLKNRYRAAVVTDRLWYAGLLSAMAVLMVGTVFGYLKLDAATRGYYSGRLKLASTVMLLVAGVVVASVIVRISNQAGRTAASRPAATTDLESDHAVPNNRS